MSLCLRQAVAGRPTVRSRSNTCAGLLEGDPFIAYTSGSDIVLLDGEHDLLETLPFWSALPYRSASSSRYEVDGVIWDQAAALLVAWSGVNIVFWHRRVQHDQAIWVLHSALVASAAVTALSYQAGMLAVGHGSGLDLWKHDEKAAVVVWNKLWDRSIPSPTMLAIAPSLGHLAFFAAGERCVRILSINGKGAVVGIPQEMRHPRELDHIAWRKPRITSGDPYLYTITVNSVMRIYAPVLDDPTWFQLHSTLDSQSFAPRPPMTQGQGKGRIRHPLLQVQPSGSIWPLDGDAVRAAILDDLAEDGDANAASQRKRKLSDPVRKVLEGIEADEADLVLWVGADGVIAMRSILNMDRKPPTLLKSSLLAHTRLPVFGASPIVSAQPHIVTSSNTGVLQVVLPAADGDASQSKSISSYQISLSDLISSKPSAVRSIIQPSTDETPVQLSSPISDFVRTPNGRGLLSIGQDAEIGVWSKEQRGKPVRGRKGPKSLLGRGHWRERHRPELCTIYAKGRAIVFYVKPPDGKPYISLQHLDHRASRPSPPTRLPEFGLEDGDEIKMLSAASDIDDGYSTRDRRTQQAVIIAVSAKGQAWIWRVDARKDTAVEEKQDGLTSPGETDNPDIRLVSPSKIPCCADEGGAVPAHVLPVDPMGWHQSVMDWANQSLLQDIVLTISPAGVLEFWRPRIGDHVVNSRFTKHQMADNDGHGHPHKHSHDAERWIRTGTVHTERTDIRAARCSSRKKTVLVRDVEGEKDKDRGKGKGKMQEMTIWDSNVGEFSTGLEMCKLYPGDDIIQDLDWTTTSDLQSILAVGFPHRIELVCEQRMSYTEGTPGWATFVTIDMKRYCPSPIADSIWLAGGSLAVGCGNQIYLFSRYLDRETPIPTPRSSVKDVRMDDAEPEDVFQLVARQNGPVVDYHPTILAQCVLWDKVDLVKSILVSLSTALRVAVREEKRYISWNRLDPTDFIVTSTAKPALAKANTESRYDALFNLAQPNTVVEEDDPYSASMVDQLTEDLANERIRLPLSRKERSLLGVLAKAVLEAAVQKRALDAGGLRYLFSLRMHVHELEPVQPAIAKQDGLLGLSHSASSVTLVSNSPPSTTSKSGKVARLSFRNIVWASHSESQEMMLAAATETCPDGKMRWEDAKRLGVFLWLRSAETVKQQLEAVARNRFMAEDLRDPTTCSLIFFALGKKKVVHGLWRQAPEHKEQNLMLKFLANDFELDRWKLAAKKNAYALLSKQRYEYAAAFFMLAGAPRDAINVVLRQMGDWQLAYALARAVETGTGAEGERLGQGVAQGQGPGPLVRFILEDTVIPMAFEGGHRWLATWAFWTLSRRDLAVQVLISPMTEVASAYSPSKPIETGFPENDDPSLLLLFSQLKSRSLQTAKGTAAISGKTEFDFVLHNARVFCRMGCHPLALALLREWSFERPELPERYIPKAGKARGKAGRGLDSAMATSSIDTPTSEDGNAAAGLIPPSGPSASGMQRKTSLSFGVNGSSARPTATSPRSPTRMMSYSRMRRPSFMLAAQNSGRRESMVADMEPEPESGSDTDSDTEESAQRQQNGNGSGVKEPYGSNGTSRTVATGAFPWDLIPEESSAKPAHIESVSPGSDTPSSKRNVGPTAEIGVRPDTPKVAAEPATTKKDPGSDVEDMPKKGMGNLMKLEQKGNVNQGAAEFSFDSFGF